jgi:hypothetical protein
VILRRVYQDLMNRFTSGQDVSYRLGGKMAYGGGTSARATR